jgi:hypothetical protein
MTTSSLEQSINKNQQKSSWIDDPFDMKGTVIGLTPMSNEHKLNFFAQELVGEYGSYNFDSCTIKLSDIPEHEQNNLVRLYVDFKGRELTECVNGQDFSIENEYSCALLSMLENDCKNTREHFAEVTRKNILSYYSKSLQELLDTAANNYLCDLNNEAGYFYEQDRDTGEVSWSKN